MNDLFYLTRMIPFHCKRNRTSCEKCQRLYDEGSKFCILKLITDYEEYPVARPIIEVNDGKESTTYEFDFFKCYNSMEEALHENQGLTIIIDNELSSH